MASSYSTNLAIELIGTGDQAGTWGVTTNTNLGTLIEQAISGYVTQAVSTGTDTTITIPNGATGVARNMYIELTGTGGASTNLVVPAKKKLYFIYNNTASGQVTVKVAGQTGVSVPNGAKMILVNDGTDIVDATNYVGNISAASGNITTLTSASATITNLIATSSTITNLLATSLTVSSGSTLNGGVVVNETGADVDFRIESDTNANAFFLQGSDGFVGIGTAAPIDNLDVYGGITISTVDAFEVTGSDSATTQVVFQGFRGGDGVKTGTAIRIRSVGDGAGNANKAIFDTLDTERFRISDTEAVFNEPGADVDFRIESDTNTHAFFLQGSDGFVGVGTDSPADELHINTTGSNVNLRLTRDTDTGARISASDGAGVPIIKFDTIASGTATERMVIDSSGNVGIGTSSPSSLLHLLSSTADTLLLVQSTFAGGDARIGLTANSAGVSQIRFGDEASDNVGLLTYSHTDNSMAFRTNSADRMTIDSSGNVGIGTSAATELLQINAAQPSDAGFKISSSGDGWVFKTAYVANNDIDLTISSENAGSSPVERLRIDSSGNVGIGTNAPSEKLDVAGNITADDLVEVIGATNAYIRITSADGAGISQLRLGDAADLDVGAITYDHTSNFMAVRVNAAERLRVDSSGNVGLGTDSPDTLLHLSSAGGNAVIRLERDDTTIVSPNPYGAIEFEGQDASAGASGVRGSIEGVAESSNGGMALVFSTAPSAGSNTERARIDRDGNLLVGKTSDSNTAVGIALRPNGQARFVSAGSASDLTLAFFRNGSASEVGSIATTSTATTYNTSSDRRLKENIAPADDAGAVIDAIEIVKHDWKAGGHTRYSAIAQDLHAVAPEAVTVGDDGEEVENTWGVDYSKLVPMLVKEIQSLRARVAALEGAN